MADDHRLATTHLGRDLVRLLRGYPGWQDTDEGHEQFGLMMRRVLRAALVAADPDRQAVTHDAMDRAHYAANRTLAEIVKMTPVLAKAPEPDAVILRAMARAYRDEWGSKQDGEPSEWWWSQCEKGLLAALVVFAKTSDQSPVRLPCASDMLGNLSRTGDKEP